MSSSQTTLLKQAQAYVDEYVNHVSSGACANEVGANAELRRIIAELEHVQTHPDQPAKVAEVSRQISDQIERLRTACGQPHRHPAASQSKRTLGQALREYFDSEIEYLARAGGATRREQTNLLLGDLIADLKALALHPNDEQALVLAADLEAKREQLRKVQRPWQQTGSQ